MKYIVRRDNSAPSAPTAVYVYLHVSGDEVRFVYGQKHAHRFNDRALAQQCADERGGRVVRLVALPSRSILRRIAKAAHRAALTVDGPARAALEAFATEVVKR